MDHNKEFETLIKKDRDLHLSRSWRGNLLGYLEKVKEDPTTAKLAHARLYDRIMKAGVRDIHESGDPHVKRLYKDESIKVYDFFADEFFGIEKTIARRGKYRGDRRQAVAGRNCAARGSGAERVCNRRPLSRIRHADG